MGGDYYDRDVVTTTSTTGYSNTANQVVGVINNLDQRLDPIQYTDTNMRCENRHPIVFALDVTGSMGEWSKVSIYYLP